jgi:hypothetical protein
MLPGGHVLLAPGSTAKVRNPIVVAILSFVTLGIYGIFWWYYINREMADYGRALGTEELGDDPATSTLALFPGGLVVVPAIWTAVTTFQRTQAAQRRTGQTPLNGWLAFVLVLVFSRPSAATCRADSTQRGSPLAARPSPNRPPYKPHTTMGATQPPPADEYAAAEVYQESQRQPMPTSAASTDRPRPLEFDRHGFPVTHGSPQRSRDFMTRVDRLLSP